MPFSSEEYHAVCRDLANTQTSHAAERDALAAENIELRQQVAALKAQIRERMTPAEWNAELERQWGGWGEQGSH